MNKYLKNPRIQAALGLVVVVLLGWWLAKTPAKNSATPAAQEQQTAPETVAPKTETKTDTGTPSTWEGMLKLSDNPQKGNLMLLTTDKKIYIRTNRDFSALVDKVVLVTYEGTSDAFRLGDIVEKSVQNSDTGN